MHDTTIIIKVKDLSLFGCSLGCFHSTATKLSTRREKREKKNSHEDRALNELALKPMVDRIHAFCVAGGKTLQTSPI